MATTVKQSFREFSTNLNITDRQETAVSNSRSNVVKTLKAALSLHPEESKLIGSYDRDTLIRPLSDGDVDIMVVLHYKNNEQWDNPSGTINVLDKFRRILSEKYPKTTMRRDRNCISMQLSQFKLDIVPGFKYDEGYYTIPDCIEKSWLKTNPFEFTKLITNVNKTLDQNFIPLIKMVKCWNKNHGNLINSFHLECIMWNHYKSYTQSYTFSSTLKVFFQNLSTYLSSACYEPILGERVDGYMDNGSTTSIRELAVSRAAAAASRAERAVEWEEDHPRAAIDNWRIIFGDFFPAYG